MTVPNFLTVKQFSEKHPAFPEGGIRHRIFYAATNGLEESGAIVRNGRRVLIDEERWFAWLVSSEKNAWNHQADRYRREVAHEG